MPQLEKSHDARKSLHATLKGQHSKKRERNKKEREREKKKKRTYFQKRIKLTDIENKRMVTQGETWGGRD